MLLIIAYKKQKDDYKGEFIIFFKALLCKLLNSYIDGSYYFPDSFCIWQHTYLIILYSKIYLNSILLII